MKQSLVFDGIVFSLQQTGGISVLFSELFARLPAGRFTVLGYLSNAPDAVPREAYVAQQPRRLERYRRPIIGGEAAVFHSTYYRLPARSSAAVVTTVYDYVYERFDRSPRRLVHSAQKTAAIRGADRIICISENTRRDLLDREGARFADRTVVVPLAASSAFRPDPTAARTDEVLFVGGRGAHKNFQNLVRALAPLADHSLLVIGGGPFTTAERELLHRCLPHRHHAAGYLTQEELNAAYARAFCLAYPSRYEGFGIPVLEAMRAGCPVVAVNASSIPEVAGDAALLLDSGDPDEIREALESLRSADARATLVARGLSRGSMFSWDNAARQTVAVYEELLGFALNH